MKLQVISSCTLCCSQDLDTLWDLPKFPFTEKYGKYDKDNPFFCDQALLYCNSCGHVQLGTQIDPNLLYTPDQYAFRTAGSKTAREGTLFFHRFFSKIAGDRNFEFLMDVGGNGRLLAELTHSAKRKCIVDPVCSESKEASNSGIDIYRSFIEELDFHKLHSSPDLVFSRHVLEHISNPREVLKLLFDECSNEALYVFEIPCFENLMEANRFDAIFHQHYHYFDLFSFKQLLIKSGGEYIDHCYNRQGSCGGALLVAFKKGQTKKEIPLLAPLENRKTNIRFAIEDYQKQMLLLRNQLQKLKGTLYGYGASLMLATLGYHLQTDFSECSCILDDDKTKDGISYVNVPVLVKSTETVHLEENANYLITSLENTRSIYNKISTSLKPRRILTPLVI